MKNRPCGNPECSCSTTIVETLSFGSGELDFNGFWEKPCFICSQHFEKLAKEAGEIEYQPYWPVEEPMMRQLAILVKDDTFCYKNEVFQVLLHITVKGQIINMKCKNLKTGVEVDLPPYVEVTPLDSHWASR